MTLEVRIAFVLFFFAVWLVLGLLPWVVLAVLTRGRGALLGLPLALAAAAAAGVIVPLAGLRDFRGFLVSLVTALAGSALACILSFFLQRRLSNRATLQEQQRESSLPPPARAP